MSKDKNEVIINVVIIHKTQVQKILSRLPKDVENIVTSFLLRKEKKMSSFGILCNLYIRESIWNYKKFLRIQKRKYPRYCFDCEKKLERGVGCCPSQLYGTNIRIDDDRGVDKTDYDYYEMRFRRSMERYKDKYKARIDDPRYSQALINFKTKK